MTGRLHRSNRYIGSAAAALLIGLSCSSAIASNGFRSDCDEINEALPKIEIPSSSLTIKLADHGLTDSAADMKAPASDPTADKVTSPTLAETTESKLKDDDDVSVSETDTAAATSTDDLPETALRLPGVSEKELPRFRRQMYRTDI